MPNFVRLIGNIYGGLLHGCAALCSLSQATEELMEQTATILFRPSDDIAPGTESRHFVRHFCSYKEYSWNRVPSKVLGGEREEM